MRWHIYKKIVHTQAFRSAFQINLVTETCNRHPKPETKIRNPKLKPLLFSLIQTITLDPHLQRVERCEENIVRYSLVLAITGVFDIDVNDFGAKKSTCCYWVLVLTEIVSKGTQ